MNGVPSLLIASGLIGARTVMTGHGRRAVRAGYAMLLAGLLIPGVLDVALRAISPPFLMPIEAVGLLLVGLGGRNAAALSPMSRRALIGMGILPLLAFLTALIPMDLSDRLNGYRGFGVLAYLLVGVGWIVFGASLTGDAAEAPRQVP